MKPIELQEKLLEVVNAEIGEDAEVKEGKPVRLSETGEDYIEFGCKFKEGEFPKVLKMFKETVKGYKDSVKFVFNGRLRDINCNGKLKVYWRHKPEVHSYNKVKEDALFKVFITLRNGELEEAEQKIKEDFTNTKNEDYTFYTRFLFTYQEKY